jgi:hypothetical protein
MLVFGRTGRAQSHVVPCQLVVTAVIEPNGFEIIGTVRQLEWHGVAAALAHHHAVVIGVKVRKIRAGAVTVSGRFDADRPLPHFAAFLVSPFGGFGDFFRPSCRIGSIALGELWL